MRIKLFWIGYFLLLFAATHYPIPQQVAQIVSLLDKVIHASAYFGLTMLTAASFLNRRSHFFYWVIIGAVLAGYGALDEYLQGFVNRSPDFRDWIADVVGIVAGCLLSYRFRHWMAEPNSSAKWDPVPAESPAGRPNEQKSPSL